MSEATPFFPPDDESRQEVGSGLDAERAENGLPDDAADADQFATGEDSVAVRQAKPRRAEMFSEDPVQAYLKQIGKYALIDAAEEVDKSKRIEAGLLAEQVATLRESKDPKELREGLIAIYRKEFIEARRKELKPKIKTPKEMQKALDDANPEAESYAGQKAAVSVGVIQKLADNTEGLSDRELSLLVHDGEKAKNEMIQANLRLVVRVAKRYTGHGMDLLDIIEEGNIGLMRGVEKFDFTKGYKFSTYGTWWIRQGITRAMGEQARTIRIPQHVAEALTKLHGVERELYQELGRKPTPQELGRIVDMEPEKVLEFQSYDKELLSFDQPVGDDGGGAREAQSYLGDFIEDVDGENTAETALRNSLRGALESVLGTLTAREAGVIKLRYGLVGGSPRTLEEIGEVYGVSHERIRQIQRKAMKALRERPHTKELHEYLE